MVELLSLKKTISKPFGLYQSRGVETLDHCILVTGIGHINSALATAWLAGFLDRPAIWLNVGLAGHQSAPLGQLCIGHSVLGPSLTRKVYPVQVLKHAFSSLAVHTQTEANGDYNDALFDMEASGFVNAAQRFASLEFVQVLKVVSDNAEQPFEDLNIADAYALLKPHAPVMQDFAVKLHELLSITLEPNKAPPELSFKASHSQKRIIGELIYGLELAGQWSTQQLARLDQYNDAKSAMAWLQSLSAGIALKL